MKVRVETTAPSSALEPVVGELEGLVQRLDQEAASEEKHKEWCVHERTESVAKRDRHQGIVTTLTKSIADTKETIGDKELSLQDNSDAVSKADSDFADLENLRSKAKSDFEAEYQDYQDAITALSQAGEMLTEFYRSGDALLQMRAAKRVGQPTVPDASVKVDTPGMNSLSGEYESKGGPAGVLGVLSTTRQEFETGAAALQESERQQESEFQASKTAYNDARNSLVQAGNQLTVELQTAQASLAADEQNLKSNEEEVTAASQYLAQVGASCDSLEAHFDDRQALRGQERQALTDAIEVLKAS
jgi:chromosome segregation ATPase